MAPQNLDTNEATAKKHLSVMSSDTPTGKRQRTNQTNQILTHQDQWEDCCEVTTRSTKVGHLMYLGNSNGVLLVLILSCCEDEPMLLA
jgi:hypothetical protein